MMTEPIFRSATHTDFPKLTGLLVELGYDLPTSTVTENIQEIRARGGDVFVAEGNGRLLGCVAAIIDVRLAGGICGEIVSLVVAEGSRGQGVGRGLVRHAEAWLGQFVGIIRVRTNAVREAAHKFYESGGYTYEKTQKVYKKKL